MANMNITKVYLLNAPLENDYKHTLYFNSKSSQEEYFKSRIVKSYEDFSYQRKDNIIRVPDHFDNLQQVNYVMYQNSAYSSKWFYAFVTDVVYVDDGRTDIHIDTDYIQTWMFDITIKPSFVEREHVSDDTVGIHTVPEQLETGPYICNEKTIDDKTAKVDAIYMAYNDYANSKYDVKGNAHGGVYSGMGYDLIPFTAEGITSLNTLLSEYDKDAKAEGIAAIFMGPSFIKEGTTWGPQTIGATWTPGKYDISQSKSTNLNGYTPRNKKLLTFPFNYLYVSNNAGGSAVYRYESFSDSTCNFEVQWVITPGMSIRMNPKNYNGISLNNDEGINLGKYATCCWTSDAYTNWLTSNSVNVGMSLAAGAGAIVGGVALGLMTGGIGLAVAGTIGGGLLTIGNSVGQVYQHSLTPDQAKGNTNCGDVMSGSGQNCFMFYKMSLRKEYAQIIDKYFDMFGYKVNMVKTPNTHHRSRYWYTKTIDVNIDGAIPTKDMQKIKDCYNSGITFWRNASEIQNYELSNEIRNIV